MNEPRMMNIARFIVQELNSIAIFVFINGDDPALLIAHLPEITRRLYGVLALLERLAPVSDVDRWCAEAIENCGFHGEGCA